MKLPRKGILIRLGIYLPIIGYLAWSAFSRYREPEQPQPPSVDTNTQDLPRRTFTAEDGSQFQVIEVTPEQAEQMGAKLPDHEADAKASPAESK